MKKALVLFFVLVGFGLNSKAQDYDKSIGIRGGFSNGITYKQSIGDDKALEFIMSNRWSNRWRGWKIAGLYEVYRRDFDVDGLTWYYGAGAHVGYYRTWGVWGGPGYGNSSYYSDYTVAPGLDAIFGIEFKIPDVPFAASLDWKPEINFWRYNPFWADEFALSIRYTF
jgi:hypothetical protein